MIVFGTSVYGFDAISVEYSSLLAESFVNQAAQLYHPTLNSIMAPHTSNYHCLQINFMLCLKL